MKLGGWVGHLEICERYKFHICACDVSKEVYNPIQPFYILSKPTRESRLVFRAYMHVHSSSKNSCTQREVWECGGVGKEDKGDQDQ